MVVFPLSLYILVTSYRKHVLLLLWRKKHCIWKESKTGKKVVGNSSRPDFVAIHRVGFSKMSRNGYYHLKLLPFKAGTRLWVLPLWQQEDSRTWSWEEKKNPRCQRGNSFYKHLWFGLQAHRSVSKEVPLGSASMPPVGGQHQKASHRPLGSASFVLTLPASHKIVSRGRSPGDKPKENNVSRWSQKVQKNPGKREREYSLVLKEVGKAVVANKARQPFRFPFVMSTKIINKPRIIRIENSFLELVDYSPEASFLDYSEKLLQRSLIFSTVFSCQNREH